MQAFDHNSAYLWTIIGIGLAIPVLLGLYAHLRAYLARRTLNRLQSRESE